MAMAMALPSPPKHSCTLLALFLAMGMAMATLDQDLEMSWGAGRGFISGDGGTLTLSLDRTSGSGFRSKNTFLFARVDVQLKLVANNSAGTVATLYLLSEGPWGKHDEIDLEFLGNVSGQPYTLHTNIYVNGTGQKEEQFHLWFDPTLDFHTYSIVWTSQHILVSVDGTPVREFRNHAAQGVAYPGAQPMRAYGSLWDAEDWATQGGRVKTDWALAPFVAQYRNFTVAGPAPGDAGGAQGAPAFDQAMDATAQAAMKWARQNWMVYDYCSDGKRWLANGGAFPPECSML